MGVNRRDQQNDKISLDKEGRATRGKKKPYPATTVQRRNGTLTYYIQLYVRVGKHGADQMEEPERYQSMHHGNVMIHRRCTVSRSRPNT